VIRVVLDTNVIVAGLRSRRGASFRLLELVATGEIELCVSVPVALEYEEVLKRESPRHALPPEHLDGFLDFLFSASVHAGIQFSLRPALPDPDDDCILELAVRTNAAIVTFNTRDFRGAAVYGVPVFRPGELLERLGGS
jgi:putative PIN family toxin of toxin-antitoxin system